MARIDPTAYEEPVVLYVTRYCGYCMMAKALLERLGIAYRSVDVTSDHEARAELVARTGRRTVPQIFVHGHGIGGYQELHELHARGELEAMLAAPGRHGT
ncbi:MAG: glutaredoxin 3 [Deltaproteobacteria bacterium]|nr:MAG: glutaredoxin 3 [Deltaproteobacteria bacterium]